MNLKDKLARFVVNSVLAPIFKQLDKRGLYLPVIKASLKNSPSYDIHSKKFFADYIPDKHDIFVCTFSKSGTNWMMQIAQQIAYRGLSEYEHIHELIPWPDGILYKSLSLSDKQHLIQSPTKLRLIKTHLAFDAVPYHPEAKYITVLRDPKDVFVSSYFFVRSIALGKMMPSPQTWLELFLSDKFLLGSWAEHLASYWAQRDKANLKIFIFEEMQRNLEKVVQDTSNFMEVKLNEAELKQVVEKSSFQYMKSIDHKFLPPFFPPWLDGKAEMMRKGKSGDSAELLSTKEQERIDVYMKAKLQDLDCDFPYDEFYGKRVN